MKQKIKIKMIKTKIKQNKYKNLIKNNLITKTKIKIQKNV